MIDIFPSSLKNIKSSNKLGQKNKEPDLPSKYKIQKILDKVLSKLLRVFNQRKYRNKKRLSLFQPLRNPVATWKTFWICQKIKPLLLLSLLTITTVSKRS